MLRGKVGEDDTELRLQIGPNSEQYIDIDMSQINITVTEIPEDDNSTGDGDSTAENNTEEGLKTYRWNS